MTTKTEKIINKLHGSNWFSNCGSKIAAKAVVLAESWKEAIRHCDSDGRKAAELEAANRIGDVVRTHSVDRYQQWNYIVRSMKPIISDIIESKCAPMVAEHTLPKAFTDTVRWSLLHAVIESEYSDICPPMFFSTEADWYCRGHFPCGWVGAFPEGQLVVY